MFKQSKGSLTDQQEASQRGQAFTNALSLDTLDKALVSQAFIPLMIVIGEKDSPTSRYGGQENYLTLRFNANRLIFTSYQAKSRGEEKNIDFPQGYNVDIKVIKRPAFYISHPTVEIYVCLVISQGDREYRFLWLDFPKLNELLADFDAQGIHYTIPEAYAAVFAEHEPAKLGQMIARDDQFESKLLPGLPPTTQPHPLVNED